MRLPEGWKKQTVGQLFDIQLGKMLSEKARVGKQYPYLANLNVRWGSFDLSKLNAMAFTQKEREKFALQAGDLLMCEGGEIGRCAVWQVHNKELFYQKALHRLRSLSDESSTDYLCIYVQFIAARGQLKRLVGESSIAHLTREKLICLKILLPPFAEQKSIANLLATWDEAIEKTQALITAKEIKFKWLLKTLISDQAGKPGWRKVKLREVAKIVKGKQLNVIHMVENGKYYALNGGIEPSGYTNDWNTPENSISISEGGNSCGFVRFNREKFWSGGHCYSLRNVNNKVFIEFLYHFLKSKQHLIMNLRVGSGLPNIQKKDIDHSVVFLPELNEQKQIAETLNIAQYEINQLIQIVEEYKIQKRGLMQKLLTGIWRVKLDGDL